MNDDPMLDLKQCADGTEALMKYASYAHTHTADGKTVNILERNLKDRNQQHKIKYAKLLKMLCKAASMKAFIGNDPANHGHYDEWIKHNVLELGDAELVADIKGLIQDAAANPVPYVSDDVDPDTNKIVKASKADVKPKLRQLAYELDKHSKQLVEARRNLRFSKLIVKLKDLGGLSEENQKVICSACDVAKAWDVTFVLAGCGHTGCEECLKGEHEKCMVDGCMASMPTQLLRSSDFGDRSQSSSSSKNYHGKKLADVIDLVKSLPAEEQVLLFVQYGDLSRQVYDALKANGITAGHMGTDAKENVVGKQTATLANFQNSNGKTVKVLVMEIGSAQAAGR